VADLEHRSEADELETWRVAIGTVVGDIEEGGFGTGFFRGSWSSVAGVLRYGDLAGVMYEHPFQFSVGRSVDLELTVGEQVHRTPADSKKTQ
jgi:hypothetical protein